MHFSPVAVAHTDKFSSLLQENLLKLCAFIKGAAQRKLVRANECTHYYSYTHQLHVRHGNWGKVHVILCQKL